MDEQKHMDIGEKEEMKVFYPQKSCDCILEYLCKKELHEEQATCRVSKRI